MTRFRAVAANSLVRVAVLVVALCLARPDHASADVITFEFSVLVEATRGDAATLFPDLVGKTITGSYTFHDDLVDLNPSNPNDGQYADGAGNMSVDIQRTTFTTPDLDFDVFTSPDGSHYNVQGPAGSWNVYFYLQAAHQVLESKRLQFFLLTKGDHRTASWTQTAAPWRLAGFAYCTFWVGSTRST